MEPTDSPTRAHTVPPPANRHGAPSPAVPPVSDAQEQAIVHAWHRAGKVRSAARVAKLSGGCLLLFAAFSGMWAAGSLAMGGFDWLSAVLCVGLGLLGCIEARSGRRLLAFEPSAARWLGANQLMLMGLIVFYAAWMLLAALHGPNPYDEAVRREPMLRGALGDFGQLYRSLTVMTYGGLIAATVVFQGLLALYYFARGRAVREYLSQTPPWVVQLQRRLEGAGRGR
jgi:hypothetical protein